MTVFNYHHFPVYSIMVLFLSAFLTVLFGKRKNVRNSIAFIGTAASLLFILALVKPVMLGGEIISYWMGNRSVAGGYAIGIALEVDALNLFFALLVVVTMFISIIYSFRYMEEDVDQEQYYILFYMLSGGVLGLILTGDMFNMYIMVEIMTFAAVALTAFRHRTTGAVEAAFKYLVVGTIGSVCLLTGIIMLYAEARTLNMAQLSAIIPGNISNATKLAFALLLIGFASKAFIVPFHPIAADAHGAAPASVSVMISGVLTKSGIYGIIRLVYFVFQIMDRAAVQNMLVLVGSVSMFVCVTMALAQHDFKRLLAFHSISQIGYVLTAAGLAGALGISAGLFHAMNHTLFKSLLFLAAGAVIHATGTGDLNRLGGLSRKMPKTTVLFLIGAFSISGIPPFNGFASKWMVYQAIYLRAVESRNLLFLFALVCALVTSVLTLASFVKVTKSVFFGALPAELEDTKEVPFGMRLAMEILAVLCVVTGMRPDLVSSWLTEPAAKAALSFGVYIDAMMGSGYASSMLSGAPTANISFAYTGVWNPISWMLLMCIVLLAVTIVAVAGKYDTVSESTAADGKYDVFFGGEKSVYSQGGGDDMFWGLKHNWRHYFSYMHNLHSGIVNDYSLWAVVALGAAMLFAVVAL